MDCALWQREPGAMTNRTYLSDVNPSDPLPWAGRSRTQSSLLPALLKIVEANLEEKPRNGVPASSHPKKPVVAIVATPPRLS